VFDNFETRRNQGSLWKAAVAVADTGRCLGPDDVVPIY